MIRKIGQILLGLILSAGVAIAMGTWGLPEEKDLIAEAGMIRITASGIGAGISMIVLLGFANGWIGIHRRRDPGTGAGQIMNGIGFGLLPAIAAWKAFEQAGEIGTGSALPDGIPAWTWITRDGNWIPARIEMALAICMFAAIVIWMMCRRQEMPDNGDLLGIAAVLWGAGRLVTDGFHRAENGLFGMGSYTGWAAAGAMAIALIAWTVRTGRQKKNTGYAWACIPAFFAAVTVIALVRNGFFQWQNPPAELAIMICAALLAMKAALCMGRVSRN